MCYKTYVCCICNADTTKPKSYAIDGKGRACRKHQEAQQSHQKNIDTEQKKSDYHFKAVKIEVSVSKGSDPFDHDHTPESYCWRCETAGILEVAIMENILFQGVRRRFFLKEELKEKVVQGLGDRTVIKHFKLDPDYPRQKIADMVKPKKITVATANKIVVLCSSCAMNHEFDWDWNQSKYRINGTLSYGDILRSIISSIVKARFYGQQKVAVRQTN